MSIIFRLGHSILPLFFLSWCTISMTLQQRAPIMKSIMKSMLSLAIWLLSVTTLFSQDIVGTWQGTLKVQGVALQIVFHIEQQASQYTSLMDRSIIKCNVSCRTGKRSRNYRSYFRKDAYALYQNLAGGESEGRNVTLRFIKRKNLI